MLEHARLLADWLGDEAAAMRAFRKHSSWYTKCFPGSAPLRAAADAGARPRGAAEAMLGGVDRVAARTRPKRCACPRGKTAGTQKVALPEGYLDHLDDDDAARGRGRGRGLGGLGRPGAGGQRRPASLSRACSA